MEEAPVLDPAVREAFLLAYAEQADWMETRYREIPLPWCPFDLWMLQEYIFAGKPYWLVETDTLWGGMGVYLGDLLDRLQRGRVLSTGMRRPPQLPEHRRVRWLDRDPREAAAEARRLIWEEHDPVPILAILHGVEDPEEYGDLLRLYGDLCPPGSYLVAYGTWRPEIAETVRAWAETAGFLADPDGERHGLTLAPGGWLHLPPEGLPSAP